MLLAALQVVEWSQSLGGEKLVFFFFAFFFLLLKITVHEHQKEQKDVRFCFLSFFLFFCFFFFSSHDKYKELMRFFFRLFLISKLGGDHYVQVLVKRERVSAYNRFGSRKG